MSVLDSLTSFFRPNSPSQTRTQPAPHRLTRLAGGYPSEISAAIESAELIVRPPASEVDDDGNSTDGLVARVYVRSHVFRGSFLFSIEAARERLLKSFPDARDADIERAARHLESRVRLAAAPQIKALSRPSWAMGWAEDHNA